MSDATLTQLTAQIRRFVEERDWAQFHTPKDLAIGLSTEAAEVLEHFAPLRPEIATRLEDESFRRAIGHELADALLLCPAYVRPLRLGTRRKCWRRNWPFRPSAIQWKRPGAKTSNTPPTKLLQQATTPRK